MDLPDLEKITEATVLAMVYILKMYQKFLYIKILYMIFMEIPSEHRG